MKHISFVHDGKFITSAGGDRSFDAALYLCEHLYGKKIADRLAHGLVIDWDLGNLKFVAKNTRDNPEASGERGLNGLGG